MPKFGQYNSAMERFWEKRNWEKSDKHLAILNEAPFVRPFPKINFRDGIYIIRGPRQVGKSSWLKTILSKFQNNGASCFFTSCENIQNNVELSELLKSIRGTDCILLDEVCFIDKWARAIKYEADSNHIKTLILTGSNAYDLRRGGERLPGRLGHGAEIDLLPMEFDEFLQMRSQAGWKSLSLQESLSQYFNIGGFPSALIEAGESGSTPDKAKQIYLKWLIGDILSAGKNEQYLREMLGQLALCMSSTLSLQKLAQRTQIGSHHTAADYIKVLEDSFALKTLYAIDPANESYRFKKEKKFYFTDPIIYWIALSWSGLSEPHNSEAQIAEMIAANSLLKRYQRIGYLSSQKGEIDFYKPKEWALEVKWSDSAQNLSKAYLECTLPNKIVWTKRNFLNEFP